MVSKISGFVWAEVAFSAEGIVILSLCLQMFTWKMFTAKLLLVLLILQGSANVFGKPSLSDIGLNGFQRTRCQVNIFSEKLLDVLYYVILFFCTAFCTPLNLRRRYVLSSLFIYLFFVWTRGKGACEIRFNLVPVFMSFLGRGGCTRVLPYMIYGIYRYVLLWRETNQQVKDLCLDRGNR